MILRPARPEERDFFFATRREAFRDYCEQAFGNPWDDTLQRANADRDFDEQPIEIIERDGLPIGYQILLRHEDHLWLDEIVVVASERNRGVGAELVTALMESARAQGLPLRLSVLHVNPAQRLYQRLGFRVTSVEPPRIKMEWTD